MAQRSQRKEGKYKPVKKWQDVYLEEIDAFEALVWKISEGGAFDRENATEEIYRWPVYKFFAVLDKHIAHNEYLEEKAEQAKRKAEQAAKNARKTK